MNKETVQRVLEINEEIKRLEAARDAISVDFNECRLVFIKNDRFYGDKHKREVVEEHELKPIRHILDLHDKMIRQEIDQDIEQLEKQFETL